MEAVILDCGHVQLAGGGCATIGCRNEQDAQRYAYAVVDSILNRPLPPPSSIAWWI